VKVNGLITFGYGNAAKKPYSLPSGLNGLAVYFTQLTPVCGSNHLTGDVFYRVTTGKQINYFDCRPINQASNGYILLEPIVMKLDARTTNL
jgi:hypothetical protein